MNLTLVAVVWALVTLDCTLIGYRLAMGRSALLDKRAYHRRASTNAAVLAQPALAAVTGLATILVNIGGPGLAGSFDQALIRLLQVAVPFALLILIGTAVCAVPSVTVRTAANVAIFGPLTLLRPLVAAGAIAYAVLPDPRWELLTVGTIVLIPGALLELHLERRIAVTILRRAEPAATLWMLEAAADIRPQLAPI